MAVRKKGATASREIAIYLRLSSADGTEAESNSIGNQRSYLHQWAAREGWQIVAEFLDDGHTGTDFEPARLPRADDRTAGKAYHHLCHY